MIICLKHLKLKLLFLCSFKALCETASLLIRDNKVKPFDVKTVLKENMVRRPRLTNKKNGLMRKGDRKKIK